MAHSENQQKIADKRGGNTDKSTCDSVAGKGVTEKGAAHRETKGKNKGNHTQNEMYKEGERSNGEAQKNEAVGERGACLCALFIKVKQVARTRRLDGAANQKDEKVGQSH